MTLVCSVMAWATDVNDAAGFIAAVTNAEETLVTLQDDIVLPGDGDIAIAGTMTIDFNGHSITPAYNYQLGVGGSWDYGKLYSNTVTFTGEGGITIGRGCLDVYSKVILNGGTFTTTDKTQGAAIWCNGSAEIEVNAGVSIDAQASGIVAETGRMIINGGNIAAEYCGALEMRGGYFEINGGSIRSNCSTKHLGRDGGWAYAVIAKGTFVMNGGTISGVQGGLSVEGANTRATIYDGVFETRVCPYGGASHYAIYVCEHAIADVRGGKFKSYDKTAMLCGNNDVTSHLGVINFYGGMAATKATVSKVPSNNDFPASIPATSQWYSSITIGSNNYGVAPLPAGYEYYDITEGEDYEAGYRYGVRAIAGKEADGVSPAQQAEQEADPTYTIPWQQSTTWATAEVPEDNTIVTIPKDATVTVSKDEETKTAVADQVYVSQGATLKVEEGTTLNIGEGGMNIGNGGQIVVEPGAIVTVGDAGIITTEDKALVIEATEEDQGVLLLNPAVTENTQPKATVKLVTKCKQVGANEFVWERFAIPTLDGAQTTFNAERLDTVTIYGGGSFEQGLYEWDGSAWTGVGNWHDLMPFKGYQLTNNSVYGNVVYTFEGNLAGNVDMGYQFAENGFGFFGNSYTGDIDIMKFFESFGSDMQKTIWIYDYYTDGFKAITETSYGSVYYGKRNARHGLITDVRSMQAFLMNTFATGASVQNVDYSAAIWGNPKYGLVSTPTPDPAPAKRVVANEDKFTVYVAGAKQEDEVTFIRSNEYTSAFDNGADASKWMNKGLNLYVATEDGELAAVASDEIVDMTIAFQSGNETEYTLGFDNLQGEQFELRDILTGATIQMTEGATYTFSQEANTTIPARFQIIGARKVPTGVENVNEGANVQQKVIENGVLYILRDNKWYNAQGQIVK